MDADNFDQKKFDKLSMDNKLSALVAIAMAGKTEVTNFRAEMLEFKEEIKVEVSGIRADINKIAGRVDDLENRVDHNSEESKILRHEINNLNSTVNRLQQQTLATHIIIKGIPECESNDAERRQIISSLLTTLNCTSLLDNITIAHRIGKKNNGNDQHSTRPILMQLNDVRSKKLLLSAKKKQKVACSQIVLNGTAIGTESHLIFFDENLTRLNSDLFRKARELRRSGTVKYAWTADGKVMVRKSEGSSAIVVDSDKQLDKLKPNKRNRTDMSSSGSENEDAGQEANSSSQQVKQQKKRKKKTPNRKGRGIPGR